MGQDCKDFLEPCLASVEGADNIVFCDGGSEPDFIDWLQRKTIVNDIIFRTFDQEDPDNNGKQRNFYLEYLNKNYPEHWCLCLDADEVVDNIQKLKDFCFKVDDTEFANDLFNAQMRHSIGDFGHEDATLPQHFVPRRLFKIREELSYPLGEHVVLTSDTNKNHNTCDTGVIWHLAYAPLFHVRSRYRKNLKHSNAHSPEFLNRWYKSHLFGKYPVSEVNINDLPACLLKAYDIEPDEIYFRERGLEVKHFIDAAYWRDHFGLFQERVLEWGCGLGPRVVALKMVGVNAHGIEISKFAVDNKMYKDIIQGDITVPAESKMKYRLVVAYDLLEHVPYEKLDVAIDNLIRTSNKYILVSVPTIGDPNLELDKTHIIKETKDWWRSKFLMKGLKELEVPPHFNYREQQMIFEVA